MGIYRLTRKDISSHNIGITYRTYQMITFLLFDAFYRTSLPWLISPLVHICVTSLNTFLLFTHLRQLVMARKRAWYKEKLSIELWFENELIRNFFHYNGAVLVYF